MAEKNWKHYDMMVNGLPQQVRYNEDTVERLFLPLLRHLAGLRARTQRKVVAFLAAPPATGKTTLALFLEQLSKEHEDIPEIRALGMDGFHYPNSYLETHFTERNGERIPLKSIKGAAETFDVDELQAAIRRARGQGTLWPAYDRNLHDVIPHAEEVDADIILIEGNWLLLDDPRWMNIRVLADYSVLIRAKPELLRDRLIERKVQGGLSREEAAAFYEASDRLNVERIQRESVHANEIWEMDEDGDFSLTFSCNDAPSART